MPALFLDRDGVVNREINYLHRIEDFEFLDGVFEVCRYFKTHGYMVIIITNQAGIARGYYSEEDFDVLNRWMLDRFREEGIEIDDVYYCPHHPEGNVREYSHACGCRKPEPGMLLQAKREHGLDLSRSLIVGDKRIDMLAGKKAGVGMKVLVETGHKLNDNDKQQADHVIYSLRELPALVLSSRQDEIR